MTSSSTDFLPDDFIFDAIVYEAGDGTLSSPPPPYSLSDPGWKESVAGPQSSTAPTQLPYIDSVAVHAVDNAADRSLLQIRGVRTTPPPSIDALSEDEYGTLKPDEAVLNRLSTLFPETDSEMLESILTAHANNFELTYTYLRQYPDTFVLRKPPDETAKTSKRREVPAKLNGLEINTLFLINQVSKDSRFKCVPEDVVRSVIEEVGQGTPDPLSSIKTYLLPLVESGAFSS